MTPLERVRSIPGLTATGIAFIPFIAFIAFIAGISGGTRDAWPRLACGARAGSAVRPTW